MRIGSVRRLTLSWRLSAPRSSISFTAWGAVNRDDRFPASGINERLGSRVNQARREQAILAQLRVRNNDFTMTLTGRRRGSIILSPAVVLGATMEEWVETNYAGLLRIYGMP